MDSFYKELVRLRDEGEINQKEYLEWKGHLGKGLSVLPEAGEACARRFRVQGKGGRRHIRLD